MITFTAGSLENFHPNCRTNLSGPITHEKKLFLIETRNKIVIFKSKCQDCGMSTKFCHEIGSVVADLFVEIIQNLRYSRDFSVVRSSERSSVDNNTYR